ncbi:peptidase [Cereibacter azotoformans]|uniref:Imelysin n=1 Tax=Cereibacter azotoformans TaxID=43057 RepID=A0A2T5K342_9RHOB|nr:imelysin family protein [Cereibacter azotoformans]AXQ94599.1 peptidase [Cereibacter sphaeroides]MBO4170557.1 peptidase [Cereibacter azotoformans]PTR16826.1 imelysin [Cereibacter azotoformans]UIJ30155.1 peptidase [Cereibacter azotoformans]
MKSRLLALAATAPCALLPLPALAVERAEVVETYADIAEATYGDSLATARDLQMAVKALVAQPSEQTLAAARTAWIAARVPYQQSEAFRFGNPIVDDWEGKVNAWPLDEGLIDYVDPTHGGATEENDLATLNVIATPTFTLSGTEVDATEITPALISGTLHEADGIEANVASGYHAIEFLLWGQDLNGTEAGAGNRPFTDYASGGACTGGNCDRRGAYLLAATDLLVSDLEYMVAQWSEGGAAREAVSADPAAGLQAMLTGMGSLSYGEQAGERMKLGLMLNDPEEEHDCFSDNTHNSHYYDGLGIRNVYLGRYERVDGSRVEGPSLSDLVAEADTGLDEVLRGQLDTTLERLDALRTAAAEGMAYDQMLAPGNKRGEELIMGAVDALVTQTASIERATTALGLAKIEFEGSDSLDDPNAVFQ